MDYEHIPFRCRKCRAHGHLFTDFPQNKLVEQPKAQKGKDAEEFEKVPTKRKVLQKATPQPNPKGPRTSNSFEKLATIEE